MDDAASDPRPPSVHPSYLTPEGVVAAMQVGELLERIRWMRAVNALLKGGRPTKTQLRALIAGVADERSSPDETRPAS